GAGKSTLIKTVTGVERPSGGRVLLDGAEVAPRDVADAVRLGIATVYQEINLLPNLSVAENVLLGRQPTRLGFVRGREMRRRAREALARFGLDLDVSRALGDFSVAVQQIVAIARAVDMQARVLILDEPTASLDAAEVGLLFDVLRRLKADGLGIVFVTHFLDQVYAVADRITVLRNGALVGTAETGDLPRLDLVRMMLGHSLEEAEAEAEAGGDPRRRAVAAGPFVAFKGYGRQRLVEPFDLNVGQGEIVGMAGLLGSGRTETARLAFGAEAADKGEAFVAGQKARLASPRAAIRHGFGYCPEERKTDGIVGELSVRENIVLALQARQGWLRPLSRRAQNEIAERFIRLLDIRTPDAERPIQALSGGNQQKALIARWLATEPRFLILDEPTRGIDVGAHAEIVRLVRNLCAEGMALLVASSELEELLAYADRVVVLRDRAHVGELEGEDLGVEKVMGMIAAGQRHAA
ncbi:MAG: sugar ABC transporter ATP-binding protein, partial [Geminicoccaceae bacterium]|nr:sugar ABC transporter ATP-binding protein [Geminicoccaceae bacterium]